MFVFVFFCIELFRRKYIDDKHSNAEKYVNDIIVINIDDNNINVIKHIIIVIDAADNIVDHGSVRRRQQQTLRYHRRRRR